VGHHFAGSKRHSALRFLLQEDLRAPILPRARIPLRRDRKRKPAHPGPPPFCAHNSAGIRTCTKIVDRKVFTRNVEVRRRFGRISDFYGVRDIPGPFAVLPFPAIRPADAGRPRSDSCPAGGGSWGMIYGRRFAGIVHVGGCPWRFASSGLPFEVGRFRPMELWQTNPAA